MAIITQAGNPTLWTSLYSEWESWDRPGWLTRGNTHYRVIQKTDGDIEFNEQDNYDLLDTRSPHKSKSATYTKLDKNE